MEFMPTDSAWRKYFLGDGVDVGDCTCHLYCGNDSHSGQWHTHEGDPCPIHKDAPMVG